MAVSTSFRRSDGMSTISTTEEAAARDESLRQQPERQKEAESRLAKLKDAALATGGSDFPENDEKPPSDSQQDHDENEEMRHISLFNGLIGFQRLQPGAAESKEIKRGMDVDRQIFREDKELERLYKLVTKEATQAGKNGDEADDEHYKLGYGWLGGRDKKRPWYLTQSPLTAESEIGTSDIDRPQTSAMRRRSLAPRMPTMGEEVLSMNEVLRPDDGERKHNFLTRTWSTLWMIAGFSLILYMGHLYILGMILVIQVYMARELFNLAQRNKKLPRTQWLNWHFFFTAMVFVYGRFLSKQLVMTISSDKVLFQLFRGFMEYHMLICYSSYVIGFVWFILTLRKGIYKYQFKQFAWTHMILLVVVTQSAFTVANIFEGIIWFLLPASLIVINDIAAYIFGSLIGRTPLIQLSPKKTIEGFLGALVMTVSSAFLLANWMGMSTWLTCPRTELSTGPLTCVPSPFFRSGAVHSWWLHVLAYGLFASIIAPFGGFFASGVKRAFKIKDFGDSIPGHGGITDRMDCQMVMAVFSYIYYQSFIAPLNGTLADVLDQALNTLNFEQQAELYNALGEVLHRRGQLLLYGNCQC